MIVSRRAGPETPRSRAAAGFRLVVIDHERELASALAARAEELGWTADIASTEVSLDRLRAMKVDALLLDPACLGARAEPYLRELCQRLPALALLVCTARRPLAVRVRALRDGVDDWLTKPFHPEEAIARVEAVTCPRRGAVNQAEELDSFVVGNLKLVPRDFQAFVGSESMGLTRREFELLQLLAAANELVLERETIYRRIWGYEMGSGDRSVDVFIRKLRQKLKAYAPDHLYIHTHFGIGYRFAVVPVHPPAASPPSISQPSARTAERDRALALGN